MGRTTTKIHTITEDNYYCKHDHSGQRATGIGLAAGLGGGALVLAIPGIWGVNKASEARNQGAMALAAANAATLAGVSNQMACERTSRETWQNRHAPTISQYVDVRSTSQQGQASTSSATADALALASILQNQNNGINNAIGNCGFLRVQRYSAPQPCGCDTCAS